MDSLSLLESVFFFLGTMEQQQMFQGLNPLLFVHLPEDRAKELDLVPSHLFELMDTARIGRDLLEFSRCLVLVECFNVRRRKIADVKAQGLARAVEAELREAQNNLMGRVRIPEAKTDGPFVSSNGIGEAGPNGYPHAKAFAIVL